MRLKPLNVPASDEIRGYAFYCPGCENVHVYYVRGQTTWEFSGSIESPTFTPSLLNTCPQHPDPKQRRCHLFLTDGKLVFCGDCSHDLAGKTVELPEYDWSKW